MRVGRSVVGSHLTGRGGLPKAGIAFPSVGKSPFPSQMFGHLDRTDGADSYTYVGKTWLASYMGLTTLVIHIGMTIVFGLRKEG